MTALRAKLYEPPPADRPVRSFLSLVRALIDQKPPEWEELRSGNIGLDISRCRFDFGGSRDLTTASDPAGGYLVKSSQPTTFFNAMLDETDVVAAGARVDRPEGDWSSIPTVESVAALNWTSPDGGTVSENAMTFGSRRRSAHLGTFSIDYTRNLRVETGGLAEKVLLSEGARVCGAGLTKAALQGSGVDNQPLGILSAPIQTTSGATYAWATANEQRRMIEALGARPTAWFCSPAVAKLLRGRAKSTGTSDFILGDDGKIGGLPCFVSVGMPDGKLLCGDFRRLTVCSESIQILFDPYTDATSGKISLRFYLFADIILEHASPFVAAEEVS